MDRIKTLFLSEVRGAGHFYTIARLTELTKTSKVSMSDVAAFWRDRGGVIVKADPLPFIELFEMFLEWRYRNVAKRV